MLQIRLLGQFDIRLDGKRVIISSRAGQSLLAYLALTVGISHRREKLAGILWPDTTDENARKYLRQELWRIRKVLSAGNPDEKDLLIADEFTLKFNPKAEFWVDVAQIEKPDIDLQSLISNLSLYQGELLPGFYDEWVTLERERVQALLDARMEQLLDQLITAERWIAVQEWGERWLTLSGVREPAYRALMLSSGARGDMAKVASLYQRCTDDLMEYLGVEPSAETHALYEGLQKGKKKLRGAVQTAGTITFLFTDIEGSTRLLEIMGDQYAVALSDHHEIMRTYIQKWHGREMDTQGDSFFVAFPRALDAVQCAVEAQRALIAHTWPQGEYLRVRMGLHTGEPLIASIGYIGMDIHRAARIGDAGHGGQILLSQTTRELISQNLPERMQLQDLGEHRLKDLKFPTSIYQLIADGLPTEFAPIRTKFTGVEAPTPGEAPFKGLQFFDVEDSDLFFGRETLTAKLVRRLQEANFLSVIIGASGSGKSSVVRAGVVPAIKEGKPLINGTKPPEGGASWQVHIFTPTAHPLEALALALTRDSESVSTAATLVDDLSKDPRSLHFFLSRQIQTRDSSTLGHILLVIDQFEELFTLCRDNFEREAFIDNLLMALSPTPYPLGEARTDEGLLTLIITLRADFYAHLAQYPELRDAVAQQQEYIGPMTTEELRLAIEEPARRGHWEFEPGLVDLILRDVGDEPGALPLLSHALLETWKRRAGHTLTLKGYAESGGVRGAIAHTAESVYQKLSLEEQTIVRNVFVRLTELGEGTEDTRRRVTFEEIMSHAEDTDEIREVLNTMAEARLITLGEDTVEVAHEALIREWPQLREWLNQDREGLQLHRRMTEAAREWELLERDNGVLYRGAQLAQAREWAGLHPNALNAGESAFLEASNAFERNKIAEREAQQKRELEAAQKLAETERQSASRLRIRNRVITTVGSMAIILALLAGMFGVQSNRNAEQAQSNLSIANKQRAAAVNAQATAMAESQNRVTQQAAAEANFRQAEAQRLAAEANRLLLGGGNPELIALLSLRSMNTQYTPQGDSALTAASGLDYPEKIIPGTKDAFCLALSPDGKYLVIGRADGSVTSYDVNTGKEISRFVGHTDRVLNVAYSPDGKYTATASLDKTTRVWDAGKGQELGQFTSEKKSLTGVAFSPDGRYVLGGTPARLWDVATGQEVRQFNSDSDIATSVTFSHDGKYVLTGNKDGSAQEWNAQTGQEVQRFNGHQGAVIVLRFSPDDKFVLTGSQDQTARLWDAGTGKELQRFSGYADVILSVAFSPDGKYVFIASYDGTARLLDRATGQELRRFSHPAGVTDLTISPDGKSIWTVGEDGIARLWNIKPEPELPLIQDGDIVNGVAFSPDGKFILTGDAQGVAMLWNANTGQLIREFKGHTDAINGRVAFSPDGKKVVTSSWDKTVRIWDIETGQELYRFTGHTDRVNVATFSPDGKYILSAGLDGARIWDPETGQEVHYLSEMNELYGAVFSPDGKYVATASLLDDGTVLWDAKTGRMLHRFTGTTLIGTVDFSPDGKYLLSGDLDGIIWLWDVQTEELVRQFLGHTDSITAVRFSPDEKYVATASYDGTARLWDAQTGQELRRFTGHAAPVYDVVISPNGRLILTGGEDGTARLWDVDYHTTIAHLCAHLRDFTEDERAQFGITDNTPTCPQNQNLP